MPIFLVNWADLSQGSLRLRRGWFGEVVLGQAGIFRTDLRGLTQALAQGIGELCSPECRADFGDARCKVDLNTWRHSGSVTGIVDRLTFTAGVDAGRSIEVRAWTAPPFAVAAGDGFSITPGCDKRLATCRDRYANFPTVTAVALPAGPGHLDVLSRRPPSCPFFMTTSDDIVTAASAT